MLHGHRGWFGKLLNDLQGCFRVVNVVVRKLLTLELLGVGEGRSGAQGFSVEGGLLVGVLPVAQGLLELVGHGKSLRELLAREPREVLGDEGVIGRGMAKNLGRQFPPGFPCYFSALPQLA